MRLFFCLLISLALTGCSVSLSEYQQQDPKLDLSQFFNGHITATGMVQDFKGKVTRRFRADIIGQWEGNKGVLDEVFYFANGDIEYRCWRIKKDGDSYSGTADDVVGEANGKVSGNTLFWQYSLQVKTDSGLVEVDLEDWIYLIDENNILNRTDMSFYGLPVGEITLHIGRTGSKPDREITPGCEL